MTRFAILRAISAGALAVGAVAFAQTSKGTLAGTVRDSTGGVLASAQVTVKSEDTGETRTLKTTSLGAYRVEGINPGLYEITVEMKDFAETDVKDIRVQASVVTSYDPVMAVGGGTIVVPVFAHTNAINTDNGELSGIIGSNDLMELPIPSLSPFEMVATLPGVQLANPALNLLGAGGNYEQLIVNGARPRSNNYMLDGQDINDVGIGGQSFNAQVPDMYQSVTALLNSTSAEFGRSGGAVMNLVTKSGTNQYHGTAFELYSGSGLDALDGVTRKGKLLPPYPTGYVPPTKARFDEHQFGFTLGGPIWKNKLFGFGGTQFTRFYGNAVSGSIDLPDAAGYAELTAIGGVSATAKAQVAVLQGLLNNGSYLTSYQYLGATASMKVSAANCPGGVACSVTDGIFQRPPIAQQAPDTQWMYRIDFIPTSSDTFTLRYIHDRNTINPYLGLNASGLPGFDAQQGGPTELGQGTWTHVFTPNLLNELRIGEIRLNSQFSPTPQTLANPLAKIYNVSLLRSPLPELGVSQNMPQGGLQELYQFQDTVGWTKGRHSLRMGADLAVDHETNLVAQNALGYLDFAGGGSPVSSSLDNFISNQLGTGGVLSKTFGPTRIDPHLLKLAFFTQDDMKVSPELTVNLGLRYDYDTWPDNTLVYPAVNVANPYGAINTVVKVQPDKNNFGPRAGFAFNPHEGIFSDGKTVFHGGFGIFYDIDFTNIMTNSAQASPNAPTTTINSTATNPVTDPAAALAATTPTFSANSSVQSVANTLRNPLTYQYNLGIEREIPAQIKVTLNYVGAHGSRLFWNHQLNPFYNGARLNPLRSAINVRDNGAISNYNAGQLEVSRAFRHGLQFNAAYTFQKELDDASEVFSLFSNPNTSYQANLQNLSQDYGESAWDRRHIFSISYVYAPAGFHSSNALADGLLEAFTRHFTISGTTQMASGPFTDVQIIGIDTNNDLNPVNDRPLIGNPSAPFATAAIDGVYVGGTPGVYYDVAKANDPNGDLVVDNPGSVRFLIPSGTQYTTQEVGRDSFENPGQSFWNMAAEKDVPAKFTHLESGMFVLRVECQNVGNHNNVSIVDTNLLDLGTPAFLNKSAAREGTNQAFRLWGKFVF